MRNSLAFRVVASASQIVVLYIKDETFHVYRFKMSSIINVNDFRPAYVTGKHDCAARAAKREREASFAPALEAYVPQWGDVMQLPPWDNVQDGTEIEPLQADVASPKKWLELAHQIELNSAWNSLSQMEARQPRAAGLLHQRVRRKRRKLAVALPPVEPAGPVVVTIVPRPPPTCDKPDVLMQTKQPPTPLATDGNWEEFSPCAHNPRVSCVGDITPLAPVYPFDFDRLALQ